MTRFIFTRFLSTLPVLFGVTVVSFLLIQLIPGDPARTILGAEATPQAIAELRTQLGLDQPIYLQYLHWLMNVLRGNFGQSYSLHVPIIEVLFPKFLNTMILSAASLLICITFGIVFGTISAIKQESFFDKISMAAALVGASMPVFWIALILMWLFAIQLGWLPTSGMHDLRNPGGVGDVIVHVILPAFATASVSTAVIARLTRSTAIEVLQKDYVRYFRSFGMSESHLTVRHVLRNALAPIVNITGLQVGYLMGGALFSEVVFNWPGIGQQMYVSINSNDYPMIQAGILLIAVTAILINYFVDIFNTALSPRLREAIH